MDGGLLPELLCQVVKSFQSADLIQQPFFIAFFSLFQVLPAIIDVLWGRRQRVGLLQGAGGEAYLNLTLSSVYVGQHVLMLCVCVSGGGGDTGRQTYM